MLTQPELEKGLAQCYGSEGYHFSRSMRGMAYTGGIKYLHENAECYWLIQAIWSHQNTMNKSKLDKEMQFWTLEKNEDNSATLIGKQTDMETGESIEVVRQDIEYTDFPIDKITIWLKRGAWKQEVNIIDGFVMMLPSEG